MERFFDPEIFDIVFEKNKYTISSKDGRMCLYFTIESDTIDLHLLDKCSSRGTILLQLLEEFARSIDITFIKLQDASQIVTRCSDNGNPVAIDLAILKLITKGRSWYNTQGYFSSCDEKENNRIIKLPCIEAIYLSQEEELKKMRASYSLERLYAQKERWINRIGNTNPMLLKIQERIDNNDLYIAENTERIIAKTRKLISDASLFPEVDLSLNVKNYLLNILPDRFDGEECDKYKFIRDFISCMSLILNYDCFLTKKISYRPSKLSMRLSRKTRCKKHCGSVLSKSLR